MNFRQLAPWPIPAAAQVQFQNKQGYRQVKYTWQDRGWHYLVRWHEPVPAARLITYPSWQFERIRPGKGFGPAAAPRLDQTLVGRQWLPTRKVRYCAWCLNHSCATPGQVEILKAAHVKGGQQ